MKKIVPVCLRVLGYHLVRLVAQHLLIETCLDIALCHFISSRDERTIVVNGLAWLVLAAESLPLWIRYLADHR